jgi:hypothetical protein
MTRAAARVPTEKRLRPRRAQGEPAIEREGSAASTGSVETPCDIIAQDAASRYYPGSRAPGSRPNAPAHRDPGSEGRSRQPLDRRLGDHVTMVIRPSGRTRVPVSCGPSCHFVVQLAGAGRTPPALQCSRLGLLTANRVQLVPVSVLVRFVAALRERGAVRDARTHYSVTSGGCRYPASRVLTGQSGTAPPSRLTAPTRGRWRASHRATTTAVHARDVESFRLGAARTFNSVDLAAGGR